LCPAEQQMGYGLPARRYAAPQGLLVNVGDKQTGVNADDKRRARLNCIAHLLSRVPYNDLKPVEIPLPPRQPDAGYKRPKLTDQRFVPDLY